MDIVITLKNDLTIQGMPKELEVKSYGKSELYLILKNEMGINISYPTFMRLIRSSLDYTDPKLIEFKRRRIIYPSEIILFKHYYLDQNIGHKDQ
tara:strand:+ start:2676 stop:2957 length:282 start_codon:yes stop_codon:yes gene_type:complete